MSILDQFRHIELNLDQKNVVIKLEAFLNESTQAFVLKGYAGSGKTTIIKGLVSYLKEQKKDFLVMAPTGRAAKILKDKTGQGKTIHSTIYDFENLESINKDSTEEAEHSFHYYFPIDLNKTIERILIVDEASMISAKESKNELFTFGTNKLLNDLLTFARLNAGNNKIIFVGDPAQLPPVTDNSSLALDSSYLRSLEYNVEETEMKQVMRQSNNLILENATKLRKLLLEEQRNELQFQYDNQSFVKLNHSQIIEKYIESFPIPEIGNGVIISFSNSQCYHYNMAIRERLYPGNKQIQAGDLVIIGNNNYHTYGAELFNGDIAKVISVSQDVILQSAPVQNKELNKKVIVQLQFRKITLLVPSHHEKIDCYILESLLNSFNRDLTIDEMKALYINFVIRFNEKQKTNKEAGRESFKVGSEKFKMELKSDPFYNALRVKYGYAITCHKAQGGEWDRVFIDYYGRISLKNDPLRWCYTATTRGINTVYTINAPNFGKLDRFKFTQIGKISNLPNEALNFDNITISPFHRPDDHKCKSTKYWEVLEKLENTTYIIVNVETKGYLERYTIECEGSKVIIQASNRNSGHFVETFKVLNPSGQICEKELENLFNQKIGIIHNYNYEPENSLLAELDSMMQGSCEDLEITITNVQKGKQFYVNYYMITDSICSTIQFYYNEKGKLTTAIPKTFNCENDEKLLSLILKLTDYAC